MTQQRYDDKQSYVSKQSDLDSLSHVSVQTPKTHVSNSKASYRSGMTTESTKEKLLQMQIEYEREKQKRLMAEKEIAKLKQQMQWKTFI